MVRSVLLLGDSLVEYGDWHELLQGYLTVNRGIAGETVGELAARLGWEIEESAVSDHILIMSGTNNLLLGDRSFPAVFQTMLPRLKLLEPTADISVIGMASMHLPWIQDELLESVNSELKEITSQARCRFLDITPFFHLSQNIKLLTIRFFNRNRDNGVVNIIL